MALEAPSNLPWMVGTKIDEPVTFSVKMESLAKAKNEQGWSCYMGQMKSPTGLFKTGKHEIPFWAMEAFFDVYLDAGVEKGWVEFVYTRSAHDKGSEATFELSE